MFLMLYTHIHRACCYFVAFYFICLKGFRIWFCFIFIQKFIIFLKRIDWFEILYPWKVETHWNLKTPNFIYKLIILADKIFMRWKPTSTTEKMPFQEMNLKSEKINKKGEIEMNIKSSIEIHNSEWKQRDGIDALVWYAGKAWMLLIFNWKTI